MPSQPTLRRTHSLRSTRRHQFMPRAHCPTVGQSFDVEISRELDGWLIRIPEIGASTHARRRTAVDSAARTHIASLTGIPIGYVTVFVTHEIA